MMHKVSFFNKKQTKGMREGQMKRTIFSKKLFMAVIFLLMVAMVVTACGGSNNTPSNSGGSGTQAPSKGGSGQASSNEAEEPLELSFMYNFDGVEFPEDNNYVIQKIEEMTNTKLSINALPGPAFEERLPILIASGEMPDAVPVPRRHLKYPYVIEAVQDGMFWEIGPYLEQFPNLSQINSAIFENISYDGKTYGLPRVRPMARRAFQYRADWLRNLGMEEPKTVDEFYDMLYAFTYNDPDLNGEDDTYGLVANGGQELANYFAPFFGGPNRWGIADDGSFYRDVQTEEFFEALTFVKRLYDDGLMNRDFIVFDRPEWTGAVEEGRAGVRIDVTGSTINIDTAVKEIVGEDAEFSMFSILENGHGKRIFLEGGNNGAWFFPKSSIETEEHLLRVLKFFDDFAGEEVSDYLTWGVEGEHHELVDGVPVRLPEFDAFGEIAGAYGAPIATLPGAVNARQGQMKPLEILDIELNEENEKHMVLDPTMPLVSETYLEIGAQIETILLDAQVKYVMGEINEDQWWEAVDNWLSRGGATIAEEFAEAHAQAN